MGLAWAALTSAGCGLGLSGELLPAGGENPNPSSDANAGLNGDDSGGASGGGRVNSGDDSGNGDPGADIDGATPPPGGGDGGPGGMIGPGGPQCDFSGTWATKITIAVDWVPQGLMGVILAPGTGAIQQWILSSRVVKGTSTLDTAIVCGIVLPDFSGTSFVGGETYGVRFPNALFDDGDIPKFSIAGSLSDATPKAAFTTTATATLIGLTLPSAATAPWPTPVTTAVDADMDMHPGVTATAATGPIPGADGATYQNVPVDVLKDRANAIYVVIRQVTQLSGGASDCDHISGTVSIPKIPNTSTGKYGIDSHVVGCGLVSGGDCSDSQVSFVDGTQPVFSPSGATAFTSVRMKGATCAQVRQALP